MAGFEPIVGEDPEILILGSMPSLVSLAKIEYYAHPRNSFWWIMGRVFDFNHQSKYVSRCQRLIENKVVVWDVLFDCERSGSLDSAIVKNSEIVNDFVLFFDQYKLVKKVIFNGAAAERIFTRYNKPLMDELSAQEFPVEWYRCPSTSPAHASMTKLAKLIEWSRVLT